MPNCKTAEMHEGRICSLRFGFKENKKKITPGIISLAVNNVLFFWKKQTR